MSEMILSGTMIASAIVCGQQLEGPIVERQLIAWNQLVDSLVGIGQQLRLA